MLAPAAAATAPRREAILGATGGVGVTYVELEFADAQAARAATTELEAMAVTGEWHLRPVRGGQAWRLSIASEVTLRPDHIARLGGRTLEDEGPAAPDDESD